MGLPAIVTQPFSMTEVETRAAAEAIRDSSDLAICVAPQDLAEVERPLPSIRKFHGTPEQEIRELPYSQGHAGECAGLAN